LCQKKIGQKRRIASRSAGAYRETGMMIPYFADCDKKSLDPSLVRHFTAGNPRYISAQRDLGMLCAACRGLEENNPKQHWFGLWNSGR